MKKLLILLLSVLFIISPITIYSHSGRTDANGGHWDRKTGTYHYHNNGYVPKSNSYSTSGIKSVDDLEQRKTEYTEKNTQKNDAYSTGGINSVEELERMKAERMAQKEARKSTYATPTPAPTEKIVSNITSENNDTDITPIQKTKKSEVTQMKIILILLTAIILILIYIIFLINKNKTTDSTSQSSYQSTAPTQEKISDTTHKKTTTSKKTTTRKTSKMKWRNKMLDISMIPKTVELDKETLLPQTLKREYGFGRRFNAFVTDDYSCYHRSKCTKIKGQKKQCIHRYIALHKAESCPDCTPLNYIDEWYIEFLKKNFNKFTTYYDFQKEAELSITQFPTEDIEDNYKPMYLFDVIENEEQNN